MEIQNDVVIALYNFWYKYWHDTGTYEDSNPEYSSIKNTDMVELDNLAVIVEGYEPKIKEELGL